MVSVVADPRDAGQSLVDGCHPGARHVRGPTLLSPSWDMNLIPISTKTAARKPHHLQTRRTKVYSHMTLECVHFNSCPIHQRRRDTSIPPHSSYSSSLYCPYLHPAFPDSIDKYSPLVKHSPVDPRAIDREISSSSLDPQSNLALSHTAPPTATAVVSPACMVGQVDRAKILMDSQKGG